MFLTLIGGVAFIAGSVSTLFGVYAVPNHGEVAPGVDSEMRFYAVWYATAGLVILSMVPRIEAARTAIRVVAASFFIAGCARLISLAVVGKPHISQLVLMGIELALPLVIVPWQASVSRRSGTVAALKGSDGGSAAT